MFGISENPGGLEMIFWASAIAGSLFFVMRVLLTIIGGLGVEDFSGDSVEVDHPDMADSALAFKLLSLNSISAFVMLFGWSGLTALIQFQLGAAVSTVVALVCGTAMMVLTAYLFMWSWGILLVWQSTRVIPHNGPPICW